MASRTKHPIARLIASTALFSVVLTGCASLRGVENENGVSKGLGYQAQYRALGSNLNGWQMTAKQQNVERCNVPLGDSEANAPVITDDIPYLSVGDLLAVDVKGDDTFSGAFEISEGGKLKLPHLGDVMAAGLTVEQVQSELSAALVSGGFYNVAPSVSVRVQDFGPARVFVSGAVFNAGAVVIGGNSGPNADQLRKEAVGGTANGRRLSRALQSAGGIRPDADLSNITILRQGRTLFVDARSAIDGGPYDDLILLDGDHVTVTSLNCFQEALVVPSSITMPGVTVFMSNTAKPVLSNASAGINKDTRELRYGTRFLEAIVAMNCTGGTKLYNAGRMAVLISRNPITGETIVIEHNIERLLRDKDRDDSNPFIMPGDALACYDSKATNIVETIEVLSTIASIAGIAQQLNLIQAAKN